MRASRAYRILIRRGEHAFVVAVAPICEATVGTRTFQFGIECPLKPPCGRVQGDGLVRGRVGVEHAVDLDRLRLKAAGFPGVVSPGDLELLDVLPVDLRKRREPGAFGTATIDGPALSGHRRASTVRG